MNQDIHIHSFSGDDVQRYIEKVAKLRIEVFREYPYLYDGDMEYEKKYLQTYIASPDSVIVIAFDGNDVVGASTAVPLRHETAEVIQPFRENNIPAQDVFYLGESVLRENYRGQGIGVEFFAAREAHARQLGGFKWLAFCAVERAQGHPRCPANYKPLDEFWRHRGYQKHPELHTHFSWKDLDDSGASKKPMVFWLKPYL